MPSSTADPAVIAPEALSAINAVAALLTAAGMTPPDSLGANLRPADRTIEQGFARLGRLLVYAARDHVIGDTVDACSWLGLLADDVARLAERLRIARP